MTSTSGYQSVPEVDYHADTKTLSASGAKLLLQSPAKFRYTRDHPVYKDVFDFGSAAHRLVLGAGADLDVLLRADSWRSNAAKEFRDNARLEGRTPILSADYDKALRMSAAVYDHPLARKLLSAGVAEQSGYWQHDTGIGLRFRPDWITTHDCCPTLVDYKTAASADPKVFARKAADFGYHIQDAWYTTGHEALTGEKPEFFFIVQEKEPPFLVSVVQLDSIGKAQGQVNMRRAIDLFAECVGSDRWPGYPDEVVTISLPPWEISLEARPVTWDEPVWGRP